MFPKHVTQFVASIPFAIVLPLAPLMAIQSVGSQMVKPGDWLPLGATYTAALGAASRELLVLILGLFAAFPMVFLYGADLQKPLDGTLGENAVTLTKMIVIAFTIQHTYERWLRHIMLKDTVPGDLRSGHGFQRSICRLDHRSLPGTGCIGAQIARRRSRARRFRDDAPQDP